MAESNVKTVFISTGFPSQRVKFLRRVPEKAQNVRDLEDSDEEAKDDPNLVQV